LNYGETQAGRSTARRIIA